MSSVGVNLKTGPSPQMLRLLYDDRHVAPTVAFFDTGGKSGRSSSTIDLDSRSLRIMPDIWLRALVEVCRKLTPHCSLSVAPTKALDITHSGFVVVVCAVTKAQDTP